MGTRIQLKSRPTKRPMWRGTFDINGSVLTTDSVPARVPMLDPRGYPTYGGVTEPVLSTLTVVDTTP